MATNVEIEKKPNENSTSLLRRFTKKIRESGILPKLKSTKYFQRESSRHTKKVSALKRIEKTQEIEKLKKLGKLDSRGRKK